MKYKTWLSRLALYKIFLFIFVSLLLLDIKFGDSDFGPTVFLNSVWIAEIAAMVMVFVVAAARYKWKIKNYLNWLLAAVGVIAISTFIYISNPTSRTGLTPKFDNTFGHVYVPLHGALKYTSPFNNPEKDYLLDDTVPEFLGIQIFVFLPWLLGFRIRKVLQEVTNDRVSDK